MSVHMQCLECGELVIDTGTNFYCTGCRWIEPEYVLICDECDQEDDDCTCYDIEL